MPGMSGLHSDNLLKSIIICAFSMTLILFSIGELANPDDSEIEFAAAIPLHASRHCVVNAFQPSSISIPVFIDFDDIFHPPPRRYPAA